MIAEITDVQTLKQVTGGRGFLSFGEAVVQARSEFPNVPNGFRIGGGGVTVNGAPASDALAQEILLFTVRVRELDRGPVAGARLQARFERFGLL
jgi:hypothetical protein